MNTESQQPTPHSTPSGNVQTIWTTSLTGSNELNASLQQELTAERQRREQAEAWLEEKRNESAIFQQDCTKYYNRLLSALAAIEKFNNDPNNENVIRIDVDLSLLQGRDAEREANAIKRLSDALTGGNASTWEQIFHAAENIAEVRNPAKVKQ